MSLNSFARFFRSPGVLSVAALLGLSGSAQATLFSFASDNESDAFTFSGTAATGSSFTMSNGRTPRDRVTLNIDDDNGVRPTVSLNVGFTASFTASWVGSVGTGNAQTHAYSVTGNFAFVDVNTGANLLTITLTGQSPAGLTIGGTMTQWASAGGLFGSDNFGGGSVTYTTTPALIALAAGQGATLSQYGIFGGVNSTSDGTAATNPDDLGFSLTFVNSNGSRVGIDPTSRLPTGAWNAEGSYSGTAHFAPAPGAVATLALGGLLVGGRRRRSV